MATPENKVKMWMKARFEKRYGHIPYWRYAPPGGYFGANGTMDELVLLSSDDGTGAYRDAPGVFVGIECKAEGQTPTPLQLKRLRDLDKAGGVAASLIGRDEEKINRIFAEIDKRRELCRLAWQITTGLPIREEHLSLIRKRL